MTSKIAQDKPNSFALLNGDEAVGRGALEATVKVATSYPGTPATEILETLAEVAKDFGTGYSEGSESSGSGCRGSRHDISVLFGSQGLDLEVK